MKLTLEITDALWQSHVDQINATEAARVAQGAAHHVLIMEKTPELRRTKFVPIPEPEKLTIEQCAANVLKAKEDAIATAQDAARDKAILAASRDDKARIVKILAQPDKDRDALLAAADALA